MNADEAALILAIISSRLQMYSFYNQALYPDKNNLFMELVDNKKMFLSMQAPHRLVLTRFLNRHNSQVSMWSLSRLGTARLPLLPDRMWVRELSHAQPCSKTVLFISSVTLLCNAAVCMCTVGGGRADRGGGAGFLLTLRAPVCVLS